MNTNLELENIVDEMIQEGILGRKHLQFISENLNSAWKRVVNMAELTKRYAELALPEDNRFHDRDFGDKPARWTEVRDSTSWDSGYLSDGDGGRMYVGMGYNSPDTYHTILELRPDWKKRFEESVKNGHFEDFLSAFKDALGISDVEARKAEDEARMREDFKLREANSKALRKIYI